MVFDSVTLNVDDSIISDMHSKKLPRPIMMHSDACALIIRIHFVQLSTQHCNTIAIFAIVYRNDVTQSDFDRTATLHLIFRLIVIPLIVVSPCFADVVKYTDALRRCAASSRLPCEVHTLGNRANRRVHTSQ